MKTSSPPGWLLDQQLFEAADADRNGYLDKSEATEWVHPTGLRGDRPRS